MTVDKMNISNEIYRILKGYERELSVSVPLGNGELRAFTTLTNKGAGLIWFEVWLPRNDVIVRAYVMDPNKVITHRLVKFYLDDDVFTIYADVDVASFRQICGSEIRKLTRGEDKLFVWNTAEVASDKLNELISTVYQDLATKAYLELAQAKETQQSGLEKETETPGDRGYGPDQSVS